MTKIRTLSRSFAGGELAPELQGRIDLDKYQTGLALCENFIPLAHGPAQARPGFRYVIEVKNSAQPVRLIPFIFSTDETMVLEMGAGYFRFHTNGGSLIEPAKVVTSIAGSTVNVTTHGYSVGQWVFIGGRYFVVAAVPTANSFTVNNIDGSAGAPAGATAARVYEIANVYAADQLFDVHYVQSNDVVTFAHPSHPVKTLRRASTYSWVFASESFTPLLPVPTGVASTKSEKAGTENKIDYTYVVTALDQAGINESEASASTTENNNLTQFNNSNSISWSAVSGAARYNVYRVRSGTPGYIGQTSSLSFTDDNIVPDMNKTPPNWTSPFDAANKYPSTVSYFDQRKAFAATNLAPQSVFMTRPGTETNFSTSYPTIDNDPITFEIASLNQNRIRHLIPLADLVALTSGGEYRIYNGTGEPVTPSTVMARPQSYVGANNVQPVVTATSALYAQAKGGRIRELTYDSQGSGGYNSEDISVLVPHLSNGYEVIDLAYSRGPISTMYAVRDDGTLLALTYEPSQQVRAWHRHTTSGAFESVACVPEGNEDVLYAIVNRQVDGRTVRYIERMDTSVFRGTPVGFLQEIATEAFRVDSGLTYRGAPVTVIGGLWHLEGETVTILADGAVMPPKVVTNGQVALEEAASVVHVGLPITSTMITLPVTFEESAAGQGLAKNVIKAHLRVFASSGIFVGPNIFQLREYKQRTVEPYGQAPALTTGIVEVPMTASWGRDGVITIVQRDPLPLTVQALVLEVAVGG